MGFSATIFDKSASRDGASHRTTPSQVATKTVAPQLRPSRIPLQRKCAACEDEKKLQTKLAISEPGDALEREADDVANNVMRMAEPVAAPTGPSAAPITGAAAPLGMPDSVGEVLRSAGRPLDADSRAFMESRFGRDFGAVHLYTDERASRSAAGIGALAYTVGSNIVFGAQQYRPATEAGRRLLAHELAHVVQQQGQAPAVARQSVDEDRSVPSNATNNPQETGATTDTGGGTSAGSGNAMQQKPQQVSGCPCTNPPNQTDQCSGTNASAVSDAFVKAAGWLPVAQQKVDDFIAETNTAKRAGTAVERALNAHFGVPLGGADPGGVANTLSAVIKRTTSNISNTFCSHCPTSCGSDKDSTTIAAASPMVWHKTNCYTYCPTYFDKSFTPTKQAAVVLHEMMHSWENMGDAAYENQGSGYPPLTQIAKITADCFACAIRDLG